MKEPAVNVTVKTLDGKTKSNVTTYGISDMLVVMRNLVFFEQGMFEVHKSEIAEITRILAIATFDNIENKKQLVKDLTKLYDSMTDDDYVRITLLENEYIEEEN